MNMHQQVGKNVANWKPVFANWIQLANGCQLNFQSNQRIAELPAKLAVGNAANLPTEISPCFHSFHRGISVGENSPSYYVGEGTDVPSLLRGGMVPGKIRAGHSSLGHSILAIDLGTQTGWALCCRDGRVTSGTAGFRPQRFEGGGMRFLRFKRWLTEIKQSADGIDAVYFEEVRRHAGVDAAHAYGGFLGQLTAWCEHHQLPYQGVPVGTIKKYATGRGNASKDDMIAAMQARGHEVGDDNEADALALLHWAVETQGGAA